MEMLIAFLSSQIAIYAAGGLAAVILGWILKKIPNEKIKIVVGEVFYKLGIVVTLGLSRWKYTKRFWNKTLEPWVVDLIDNIVGEAIKEFIRGLRSDNKEI